MMKHFIFFLIFFLSAPAFAEDHNLQLQHDGITRDFIVHTPPQYNARQKLPLFIVMHGGGSTAQSMKDRADMDSVADKHSFIAVYPNGVPAYKGKISTWNAGYCCGPAFEKNIDDVGFISLMIDYMSKHYAVDTGRVYATGMSNGAMMSYRLACEIPHKITAIAPVAAQGQKIKCNTTRRVPILHIHGIEDPCAKYNGGQCGGCFGNFFKSLGLPMDGKMWPCDSVKRVINDRALQYGCRAKTKITMQKGDTTCETWQGCPSDTDVTLCSVEGAGHMWPGAKYGPKFCQARPDGMVCNKWKKQVGPTSHTINASEFAWEFVSKYKM